MLLVADIGNSNILLGLFENSSEKHPVVKKNLRFRTDLLESGDVAQQIDSFFHNENISTKDIDFVLVSSVVPSALPLFIQGLRKNISCTIEVLNESLYDFLPITIPKSVREEIGTDLIANAVAGFSVYPSGCIIVDFGTALSFTVVDKEGCIQGVSIAPGLETAMQSLFKDTAQLPTVPLRAPSSSLGKTTVEAIQSGIVLGYGELVKGLLERLQKDLGYLVPVIATGGLSSIIEKGNTLFNLIDVELTVKGLFIIAKKFLDL